MDACTNSGGVYLVAAIVGGLPAILASLATFIRQVRSDAHVTVALAQTEAKLRSVVADEVASVTGNGHSVPSPRVEGA